ncbi:MAG: FHA domain-containing protein [Proteobacteria bacterium]|jgi:pilus assembly protein CpaF|nr:FHA domain-containing protein [Pseudomonadota bacterium]
MFTITVAEKGGSQRRMEFDEDVITIGRVQGNHIVLPRGNVSKQHARLEHRGGELRLTDLNSTNGTYINGRRITETALVVTGDKVYIGEFIIGFEDVSAAEASAARPIPSPPAQEAAPKLPVPRAKVAPVRPSKRLADATVPSPVPSTAAAAAPPRPAPRPTEEPAVFSSVDPSAAHAPAPLPRPSTTPRPAPAAPKPQPAAPQPAIPAPATDAHVEQLLEALARQVKRIELGKLPARVDEGTAGKVRIVLRETVDELVSHGKLPPTHETERLLSRAFRAAVDLGPLSAWLEDAEVREIRILSADTVLLRRRGGWSPAGFGFVGEDALAEALRCLGSGVPGRDEGGVPGLVRYRLEDGAMVLAALPPVASSGTSASIYKNLSPRIRDAAGAVTGFDGEMRAALEKAVIGRSRIAVVGSALPYRLSAVADVVRLIPATEVIVGVEDIPLLGFGGPRRVGLAAHGLRKGELRAAGLGSLLPRAVDLSPEWIAACGAWWDDVPELIACAAGRKGFVAELPLTAERALDHELASGLAAAGIAAWPEQAARLLVSAFDIIAVADVSAAGEPIVTKLIRPGLAGTEWAPKVFCERAG